MIRSILADERGVIIVLVAISMVAVVSAAAIAIDIGKMLSARAEAQRAADAGALAGASAFIDDMENAVPLAKARAKEFGELHRVRNQGVIIVTDEDVQVDVANRRVDVTVRHLSSRANPIPTFFARVFGVVDVDIQAHAAAEAVPANAVGCLTPWAVADMWEDTYDLSPKYEYDDADRSNTPTSGDEFDNYCPCVRNDETGVISADPDYLHNGLVCQTGLATCTGYGSAIRDNGIIDNDVGRVLTLKPGNPNQSWSPGWFMAWRPPENMGGADYKENIINCIDEEMFTTDDFVPIDTEQGNMIGPTIQGVEERIGDDPHYWLDTCHSGTECIRSYLDDCGVGDNAECKGYDARLITVPLMDPTEVMRNGMTEIKFRGFMRLFLDDPDGNNITGHILGLGGAAGSGGLTEDTGALPLYLRLIE